MNDKICVERGVGVEGSAICRNTPTCQTFFGKVKSYFSALGSHDPKDPLGFATGFHNGQILGGFGAMTLKALKMRFNPFQKLYPLPSVVISAYICSVDNVEINLISAAPPLTPHTEHV